MADIRKLEMVHVGEDHRFNPDATLEAAKGQPYDRLVILGALEDGQIWVSGNANLGESLVMIEKAKRHLIFGEE